MWLSDFEEAIAAMKEYCGWSCFSEISTDWAGESFIFNPYDNSNFYFVYFRKSKRIVKRYQDTWKHPEHQEIIYEGDK